MILKLSLNLPEDGTYVRIARRLCRALLEELAVVESDTDDLEILIGELCTNVVRHAQDSDGRYQVVMEFHAHHVDLTVIDTGTGFAPAEVAAPGTERPDTLSGATGARRIGGYGMSLIAALADTLEFKPTEPQGTTVHARVALHYPSSESEQKARSLDANRAEITGTMN